MIVTSPPLLTRLRRLHGAWGLCVFVVIFKLVTGMLCLADGSTPPLDVEGSNVSIGLPFMSAEIPGGDNGDDCVLGESGGCHCACAHAVPLSHSLATGALAPRTGFDPSALSSGYAPTPPGSLLRPPIA